MTLRLRRLAALLAAAALVVTGTFPVAAATPAAAAAPIREAHAKDRVIVGFRAGAGERDRAASRASVGATAARALSSLATDAELLSLPAGRSVEAAIAALQRNPVVRYAQPDYILTKQDVSNDAYYTGGSLWGMYGDGTPTHTNQWGTGAAEAWDLGFKGSSSVYVGVIDEGIQFTHPDLDANVWTNPNDPVDGLDNDANGYVDDVHGWDFLNNNNTVFDGNTEGPDSHGTHVAGTIGGEGGNAIGVAGVNWNVTMISGKFLGSSGGYISDAIEAVDYFNVLKDRGINIVATSNSWGGGGFDQALLDAINRGGDRGILFVAAAGNSAVNTDGGASYPQGYQCVRTAAGAARGWDCVISVASITSTGAMSSFSNYGAVTVDIGAPGSDVWSTVPTNSYASYSGTSMATPHVSGAIALCASIAPSLTGRQLRDAVLNSATATASLAGKTVTGGRLDVGNMLGICQPPQAPVAGAPTGLAATARSSTTIALSWTDGATNETSYAIQRAPVAGDACGTFDTIATAGVNASAYVDGTAAASTAYCYRVRAANAFAGGTVSAWSNEATATTPEAPVPLTCAPTGYAWDDISAGTRLSLTDDSQATVALPFAFTWYGDPYTSVNVASNGYLTLGGGAATSYANVGIPNSAEPNGLVAAFWDDLNPGAGGSVYVRTLGTAPARTFVASWVDVPHYSLAGSTLSFQVALSEATGLATLRYRDVITGSSAYDRGASATAGVENVLGTLGRQVSANSAVLSDGTAYACGPENVLSLPSVTSSSLPDGTTGVAYATTLGAAGGTAPYTWALADGAALPAGLALAADGAISGMPEIAGTTSTGVVVTDAAGLSGTGTVVVRVAAPLAITATALAAGTTGIVYSATLAATGGQGTPTWSIASGALPGGLALSSAGTISGTPTAGGTFAFSVRVTDQGVPQRSAMADRSIVIAVAPSITTTTLGDATLGDAYAATLAATGGVAPYAWSLALGSLPAGLALAADGSIAGTPNGTAGTSSFTVRATGADGGVATRALTIRTAAPLAISTSTLNDGTTGIVYSATLAATGGQGTPTWSIASGALPGGLALSSAGTISGTPTAGGTFAFSVRVTDQGVPQRAATVSLTLRVAAPLSVATASLAGGTVGTAYSAALTSTGGQGTIAWSISAGALPGGLALSAAGTISGTPTAGGSFTFTVRAADQGAPQRVATRQLTIAIASNAPGAFAKSTPRSGATKISTAPTFTWTASTNAVAYQICLDTVNNNACDGSWISTGTARSYATSGLARNSNYYWQVRAVGATGATTLANAGTWWRFTTIR